MVHTCMLIWLLRGARENVPQAQPCPVVSRAGRQWHKVHSHVLTSGVVALCANKEHGPKALRIKLCLQQVPQNTGLPSAVDALRHTSDRDRTCLLLVQRAAALLVPPDHARFAGRHWPLPVLNVLQGTPAAAPDRPCPWQSCREVLQ